MRLYNSTHYLERAFTAVNLGYRVYPQVREEQQVASAEQSTEKQLVRLLYNGDLEMEWGSDAAQVWENGLKTPLELLDVIPKPVVPPDHGGDIEWDAYWWRGLHVMRDVKFHQGEIDDAKRKLEEEEGDYMKNVYHALITIHEGYLEGYTEYLQYAYETHRDKKILALPPPTPQWEANFQQAINQAHLCAEYKVNLNTLATRKKLQIAFDDAAFGICECQLDQQGASAAFCQCALDLPEEEIATRLWLIENGMGSSSTGLGLRRLPLSSLRPCTGWPLLKHRMQLYLDGLCSKCPEVPAMLTNDPVLLCVHELSDFDGRTMIRGLAPAPGASESDQNRRMITRIKDALEQEERDYRVQLFSHCHTCLTKKRDMCCCEPEDTFVPEVAKVHREAHNEGKKYGGKNKRNKKKGKGGCK